jgi:hypothetical protein
VVLPPNNTMVVRRPGESAFANDSAPLLVFDSCSNQTFVVVIWAPSPLAPTNSTGGNTTTPTPAPSPNLNTLVDSGFNATTLAATVAGTMSRQPQLFQPAMAAVNQIVVAGGGLPVPSTVTVDVSAAQGDVNPPTPPPSGAVPEGLSTAAKGAIAFFALASVALGGGFFLRGYLRTRQRGRLSGSNNGGGVMEDWRGGASSWRASKKAPVNARGSVATARRARMAAEAAALAASLGGVAPPSPSINGPGSSATLNPLSVIMRGGGEAPSAAALQRFNVRSDRVGMVPTPVSGYEV